MRGSYVGSDALHTDIPITNIDGGKKNENRNAVYAMDANGQ